MEVSACVNVLNIVQKRHLQLVNVAVESELGATIGVVMGWGQRAYCNACNHVFVGHMAHCNYIMYKT